ncbi:hypothetical protein C2R92_08880 [Helicobacter pylori]|uniref:Uncharacterized protein n=1 Tax=Helicobacter pylori TaxID=210 RepID=A0A2T6QJ89_HELPX|nr:hypothetical protein [Helicobacter pylori]PUD12323.1 hypothetical protein C2R86_01355 [Helicobacter pylori]PUD36469.1 hypothetical protein C2R92_08880 [Helicobacter pylori]
MLGLAFSGVLLFGKGLSTAEYSEFLAKEIVDLKEKTALNTEVILSSAPVFKGHDAKIEMLVENMQRMEAELNYPTAKAIGLFLAS